MAHEVQIQQVDADAVIEGLDDAVKRLIDMEAELSEVANRMWGHEPEAAGAAPDEPPAFSKYETILRGFRDLGTRIERLRHEISRFNRLA